MSMTWNNESLQRLSDVERQRSESMGWALDAIHGRQFTADTVERILCRAEVETVTETLDQEREFDEQFEGNRL